MKGLAVEVIVFGVILVLILIILILFYKKITVLAVDFVDLIVKAASSLIRKTLWYTITHPFG